LDAFLGNSAKESSKPTRKSPFQLSSFRQPDRVYG
jgi:hypothetical protein